MTTVDVTAATYYDDRAIGGTEGVMLHYRHPQNGDSRNINAPVDNWHTLAREPSALPSHCYFKYGNHRVPSEISDPDGRIFGGHEIAVYVEFKNPVDMLVEQP